MYWQGLAPAPVGRLGGKRTALCSMGRPNLAANSQVMQTLPLPIQDFGDLFVEMQRKRHAADYDADAQFTKSDVVKDIERVEDVVDRFSDVAVADRRTFAIHVLLPQRRS